MVIHREVRIFVLNRTPIPEGGEISGHHPQTRIILKKFHDYFPLLFFPLRRGRKSRDVGSICMTTFCREKNYE